MKGWSRCKADWIGHSSSGVRNKYGSSKGSSLVSSFLACIFLLSSEHHGGLSLPQWQQDVLHQRNLVDFDTGSTCGR